MRHWQSLLLGIAILMVAAMTAADVSRLTLKAEGMTPTGCRSPPAVQMTIKGFPGVHGADMSLERGEVTLEYEAGQLELEKLIVLVERMCLVKISRPPAP